MILMGLGTHLKDEPFVTEALQTLAALAVDGACGSRSPPLYWHGGAWMA
jgi:hypothetical protein